MTDDPQARPHFANRQQRRAWERDQAKREQHRARGVTYEPAALGASPMEAKVPGKHRWVVLAAYAVTEESVRRETDGEGQTYLDGRNRLSTTLGCFDCEGQFPTITPDSVCPAGGETASGLIVPPPGAVHP